MAERSHVTSFEAIEAFRASLIVFLGKARPTVEEVGNELIRMRVWLESEQRNYWTKEIRLLARQLEQAQQELFAARLSEQQAGLAMQEMVVQRLRGKIREAEEKQEVTRKWSRALEDRTDPLAKEVEGLHSFLMVDMVRAVAHLEQVVKTLEAYAHAGPAGAPAVRESGEENAPAQDAAGPAADAQAAGGEHS